MKYSKYQSEKQLKTERFSICRISMYGRNVLINLGRKLNFQEKTFILFYWYVISFYLYVRTNRADLVNLTEVLHQCIMQFFIKFHMFKLI